MRCMKRFLPLVASAGLLVALVMGQPAMLGVAALALLGGLWLTKAPIAGWPERLLALGGVAMLVFPLVAYVCLPVATGLLVGRFTADARWKVVARPVEWLSLAGGVGIAILTYVALPGHGVMIDLVERALFVVEGAALAVIAVQLVRLTLAPHGHISRIVSFRQQ
ncbi:hypothetical protein J5X84_07600 [Streptosporangiaceae bacterium NEAU-GS5]|nr:hypothetical protein [Streptosporangiaceae bacterium NEAU-GS5]